MSITQLLFMMTVVASAGVGLWLYRRGGSRPIWERLAIAVLPFLACTVIWHWVVSVLFHSVAGFWNGARLAPAMGLLYGYRLYYPKDDGPLNGWIYGPVAAIAYLPAVLIGNSGVKIIVARILSLVYYYGPAAWLLLGSEEGERRRPTLGRVLLFLTFVLLTTHSRALRYSSTEVHADAPALGLAALAIVVMIRGGGGKNPKACAISLILCVLAVWAKQLTVPLLLVVLPGYAIATGALESRRQFLVPAFIGGLGITLVLLAAFDPQSMMFNVVSIPSHHPFRITAVIDYLFPMVVLQQKHAPLLLLLIVGLLGRLAVASERQAAPENTPRPGFFEGDWLVFVLSGLTEVPFSVAAYSMVGADENSMSFFIYFTTLGALLLLKPLLGAGGARPRETTPWVWLLLIGLNLMLAIVEDETLGLELVHGDGGGTWEESLVAERFIRDHLGEAYFPWNPQSHLQVEGKYYHFEDAIYDRTVSGFPPSREHFFRYIPPNTKYVCYPPNATGVAPIGALRYLKGFKKTRPAGLPLTWACYQRMPAAGAEASGPSGAPSSVERTEERK